MESFKNQTGITYPLLLNGGDVQDIYEVPYDYSMVIDKKGIIQYAGSGVNVSDITETIDAQLATSIEPEVNIPARFDIFRNYPNPFNPVTTIEFGIDKTQNIQLNILDSRGRLVRSLKNESFSAGNHSVIWNGRSDQGSEVASGVYYARLKAENEVRMLKLMLVR